jgi:hypothetical protein
VQFRRLTDVRVVGQGTDVRPQCRYGNATVMLEP